MKQAEKYAYAVLMKLPSSQYPWSTTEVDTPSHMTHHQSWHFDTWPITHIWSITVTSSHMTHHQSWHILTHAYFSHMSIGTFCSFFEMPWSYYILRHLSASIAPLLDTWKLTWNQMGETTMFCCNQNTSLKKIHYKLNNQLILYAF